MSAYNIYDPTEEEIWFSSAFTSAQKFASMGNWPEAQNVAMWWGEGICDSLGISVPANWKFLKRSVVAKWFGKPQHKRFNATWNVGEAFSYASSFENRSVRFSLFPKDIACHAVSFQLPKEKKEIWMTVLNAADTTIDMEMFPEASTETSICFRRYTTLFRELTTYEAGKGQAMHTFEQERGKHSIVAGSRNGTYSTYEYSTPTLNPKESASEIESSLREFISTFDYEISSKSYGVCRKLGLNYLSIEGYYDPVRPGHYIVVDFDLPFDVFFM